MTDDERAAIKAANRAKSNANLRYPPIPERSPEEQLRARHNGQAAQQASIKRKRALQEIASEVLAMGCPDDALPQSRLTEAVRGVANEQGHQIDTYTALFLAQLTKAIDNGDTAAAAFVRDSAGDKPTDRQQITADVATPADIEIQRKIAARLHIDGTLDAAQVETAKITPAQVKEIGPAEQKA